MGYVYNPFTGNLDAVSDLSNYLTSGTINAVIGSYVPYLGATKDVKLGSKKILTDYWQNSSGTAQIYWDGYVFRTLSDFAANTFTSSVILPGAQPYACNSSTLNTNLNADLLDGSQAVSFQSSGLYQASGVYASGGIYTISGPTWTGSVYGVISGATIDYAGSVLGTWMSGTTVYANRLGGSLSTQFTSSGLWLTSGTYQTSGIYLVSGVSLNASTLLGSIATAFQPSGVYQSGGVYQVSGAIWTGSVYGVISGATIDYAGSFIGGNGSFAGNVYGLGFIGNGSTLTSLPAQRVVTTTDNPTAAINVATTDIYELSAIVSGTTFTWTGSPTNGQKLIVRFKDAGAAKDLTWIGFSGLGATLPATTVLNKWCYVGNIFNTIGSTFQAVAVSQEA